MKGRGLASSPPKEERIEVRRGFGIFLTEWSLKVCGFLCILCAVTLRVLR
jgi:hypothetical protein